MILQDMISRLKLSHFAIIPMDSQKDVERPKNDGAPGGETGIDARVIDGKALVTSVAEGSSAERVGVRPGWAIIRINDFDVVANLKKLDRELFANAYQRCKQRHIPLSVLATLLAECGFAHRGNIVPTDAVMQGDAYWDGTGPLRKEWRDGDSAFALATEQELEQACSEIRRLEQAGTLADYVAKQDVRRQKIGQVTFVHALRMPNGRDNI